MGWNESFERHRARMSNLSYAYRALFIVPKQRKPPWWKFWVKEDAEVSPAGQIVLRDLAWYCYASRSSLKVSRVDQHADPLALAFAEGRRDAFNRITAMCNLSLNDIERIAHNRSMNDE
jgi:hypothetical protein